MTVHASRYHSLTTEEVLGQLEVELRRRKGQQGRIAEQEIADLVPVLISRMREAEAMPLEARLLIYLADIERRVAKQMTAGLHAGTCHESSPEWIKWQASEISHQRARALNTLAKGAERTSKLGVGG
jgi:hypothetical protein